MHTCSYLQLLIGLCIIVASVDSNFIATKVHDQKILREAFASSPSYIDWGSGYNSLMLQHTFNSAVTYESIEERPEGDVKLQVKACKTGGETLSFLSGELLTAGAFLTSSTSTIEEYFKTSQMTDLNTVLIIKIDVTTKGIEMKDPSLKNRAKELLKKSNFSDFSHFYGTHYLKKVIFGGYLCIAVEFSCNTIKEKQNLDRRLSQYTKVYSHVSQLTDVLKRLNEPIAMEINVFAAGANKPPIKPDIAGIIDFAEDFIASIETQNFHRIHHVEYRSMFHIDDTTLGFRGYVLPIQEQVDKLVAISAQFQDVQCRISSILQLKKSDETFSFLSASAIDALQALKNKALNDQDSLKSKFKYFERSALETLNLEYERIPPSIDIAISKLLAKQKHFDSSNKFYLRSKGLSRYVSIGKGGYPRLTDTSPIRLMFTHIKETSDNRVAYYQQYYLLTSDTQPNYYLCMGSNNWYVFWEHYKKVYIPMCYWQLKPAAVENQEQYVSFSDRILIYNLYWPEFVIGASDDGQWLLTAYKEAAERDTKHQWVVEKAI